MVCGLILSWLWIRHPFHLRTIYPRVRGGKWPEWATTAYIVNGLLSVVYGSSSWVRFPVFPGRCLSGSAADLWCRRFCLDLEHGSSHLICGGGTAPHTGLRGVLARLLSCAPMLDSENDAPVSGTELRHGRRVSAV